MTTQLEVLNHVIGVVGETPVSSVSSTHPTAQSALLTIQRVSKEFQLRGWWFNREECLVLSPTITGEIVVPSTTLKVDPTDSRSKLVWRGTRLYDSLNHTYNIGEAVTVNLNLLLPTNELPEVAAMYLMHKAAYEFYVADDGDADKAKALLFAEQRAEAALKAQQLQMSNVNAMNRPVTAYLKAGIGQFGGGTNPNIPGGGN
jgi:hypothetical protein